MTIAQRVLLADFALANPLYANARVWVYGADVATGRATTTLATLYRAPTGTTEEANPLTLDSEGKLQRAVYVDAPVVARVSDAQVPVHDTGVIGLMSRFREEWETDAIYQVGDIVRDGSAGVGTGYLYLCAEAHTASAWAADLAAGLWVLYLSISEGMAPFGALLISENLSDVEDPDAARVAIGAASQDEFEVVTATANDAYDNIIVSAAVSEDGDLILTLGSGALLNAGSVVGPTGPVTVVGTALGTWDATTNTPTLSDGSGTIGDAYLVAVAGTTALDGVSSWSFGDTVFRGATAWERIPAASTSGVFTEIHLPTSEILEDDSSYAFTIIDDYQNVTFAITEDGVTRVASADIDTATIANDLTFVDDDGTTDAISISDPDGNIAFAIKADGQVAVPGVVFGSAPAGYAVIIADEWGDMIGYITEDGTAAGILGGGGASSPTTYSAEEQARRGARALGMSAAVVGETNTTAARPVWTYNHVLAYGQSLSNGWEGWPSLSKTQPFDNLMVGDSVHPSSESSSTWAATGTAAFNPLVATVHTGGAVIDDVTVAGYSPGNVARGETVLEGALNLWRKQQLAWRGLLSDSTRRLVASSCGVGGQSIEDLSKGASPELFNRLRGAATAAQTLATGASGTYGVTAILWLQGEHNSAYASGGETTDRETYKALQATLQADVTADIATAIAGQDAPPAFFCYQTSATATNDTLLLSIPQAQLESALELRDWYLVTPSYPVTDKGLHLDPNGYRWMGQQFGKVLHQVLDLGRGWKPVHPLRATWRGTQVLIDFHVPHPPLVFSPAYVVTTAATYADGGFTVTDDAGRITCTAEIVGDACVLLTLAREPTTNPYLWYGDKTYHNGNGNLHDSDPTVASDNYEYASGTGQYAAANIAALVDAPYPLWNWCVLFRMAIDYDPLT